ncbi:unnamed protein product, partial [marine sediment metagenome]
QEDARNELKSDQAASEEMREASFYSDAVT